LGAYEALWLSPDSSFKAIAELFQQYPGAVPTQFIDVETAESHAHKVLRIFRESGVTDFGVRVHGAGEYPARLRDAEYPVELLYFCGNWSLVDEPRAVAVVGTRKPSEEGIRRVRKLVRSLVSDGVVIVSGLAKGVDTIAHTTALECGGKTIAVIGTPISEAYPKENKELQDRIATDYLLVSQIPTLRYRSQDWRVNRHFFPERNVTMSALTYGTIIVEAGETSGTLTQARAALSQGRKLFILDNNFRNPELTWPAGFERHGAIRVSDYSQIAETLPPLTDDDDGGAT
jgi:DNA processing protein